MKKIIYLFVSLYLLSCSPIIEPKMENGQEPIKQEKPSDAGNKRDTIDKLQLILDYQDLKGSLLFYDLIKDKYYSNDYLWANKGNLPASTFKIVNSIIGLETGKVKDRNQMFKWDGKPRRIKTWEQDLNFQEAFMYSCLPCYQELARGIGLDDMNKYLKILDYGKMQFDSSDLDLFWVEGNSRISQAQQVEFLTRLYNRELNISDRTYSIMKKLMTIDANEEYTLSGKTGWSNSFEVDNGWFVGYLEKGTDVYIFAVNVEPKPGFNMQNFAKIRKIITMDGFKALGIIDL